MERIEPSSQTPYIRQPQAIYIEKPVELKTAQVGKSALKQLATNFQETKKNLRFDNEVTHKQTRGKLKEDGSYEVEVRITTLDLVDEDEGNKGITKQELIDIENAVISERAKVALGAPQDPEDKEALEGTEQLLQRLNNLFNGRHALGELSKPIPRDYEREDKTLSAGRQTGTYGKTQIVDEKSPSWPKDQAKEIQLQKLHDEAIATMRGELITTKDLANRMLELRKNTNKEEFSKEDLYNLYLDFDRKKEKYLSEEVREQLKNTPSVKDRDNILMTFYYENLLPLGFKNKVDIEEIKESLEQKMDLEFKEDTLIAKFSNISEKDINQYIEKKYIRKKS